MVVGDKNTEQGEKLESTLGKNIIFVEADVSQYNDLLTLFETARTKFGRVDFGAYLFGASSFQWPPTPELEKHSIYQKPSSQVVCQQNQSSKLSKSIYADRFMQLTSPFTIFAQTLPQQEVNSW